MGWFFRSSPDGSGKDQEAPKDDELIVIVDRSMDPHLVVYHDPKSFLSEQYRHFRTNLLALNKDNSPRSLVLTSANKGDGKSISLANIGLSLVESGLRVCLVDTDFRGPSLAGMFGLEEEPGLSDLILDRIGLSKVLVPSKVENLYLLPAGREPQNPTELLGSDRLVDLINVLKQDFHYILLDTPPVFPFTDACILGARCNGIVFVVKMEKTSRAVVQKAVNSLENAGGKVIGTFLTAIRPVRTDESHDYYYYRDDYDEN